MKKRGFTLIELLAVIVILAIIALIATPLVLKYIEYSKEKSAKLSAQTYAEAVEKEYVSKLTSNEKIPNGIYSIPELDEFGVKVKGDKPDGENDYVVMNNGNVTEYELTINGYVIKYENGKVIVDSNKDSGSGCVEQVDHTVKFMVDGKPYQVVSVIDGGEIHAPSIIPKKEGYYFKNWATKDNTTYTYPFVPTENIELYANFSVSYTEMLYSHFGVDKIAYPSVFILKESSTVYVMFASSYGGYYINSYIYSMYSMTSEDNFPSSSNYSDVVNFVTSKVPKTLSQGSSNKTVRSDFPIWGNVDFEQTGFLSHVWNRYYIGE